VTLALVAIFGPTLENLLIAGLAFLLLASSVVDWRVQRLPDVVTVSIAAVGAVLAWLAGPEHVLMGLVGSALAFGLLVLLRKVRGRRGADPGLGMGDVKLISALALWLGAATPWMVVAAAVIGLAAMCLLRPRDGRLPFGPMIAISSLAVGVAMQSGLLPWPI
jgi:leader peptidase (prepilin peptidase)/N-methyltransferase